MKKQYRRKCIVFIALVIVVTGATAGTVQGALELHGKKSGSVSGHCFFDNNANGIKDDMDPAIEGLYVSLERFFAFIPGKTVKTATNANGYYEFSGLRSGFYRITCHLEQNHESKNKNSALTWIGFVRNSKVIDFSIHAQKNSTANITVSISAEPDTIYQGELATLQWQAVGADSVSIDQGIGEVPAQQQSSHNPHNSDEISPNVIAGSLQVKPAATITYTITGRTNTGERALDSITITVVAEKPPPGLTTTTVGSEDDAAGDPATGTDDNPGGSGGGGGSSSGEPGSTTTTPQQNQPVCEEDDSGMLDIAKSFYARDKNTVVHTVRVNNAPHEVFSFAFAVTYDAALLDFLAAVQGDCVESYAFIECSGDTSGVVFCEGITDEADMIKSGDNCSIVDFHFEILREPCPSGMCPGILAIESAEGGFTGWVTSKGCFCCSDNCTDNNTRACPNQNGVCAGTEEICFGAVWSGCRYSDNAAYQDQESMCFDELDNDCDGRSDDNDTDCLAGYHFEAECSDGIDNDGDNMTDCADSDCEGAGSDEDRCFTGEVGVCAQGTMRCSHGELVCVRDADPTPELCDGLDNDCDNETDENFLLGDNCTVGMGICRRAGLYTCSDNGSAVCDALPGEPEIERCSDSIDNDCDGLIDCQDAHCAGDPACNLPPSASIFDPADGRMFVETESISFRGSATDSEDGVLSGSSLVWSSNKDGVIGTGTEFITNNLSRGIHTITLTATDTGGGQGTDSITLTIGVIGEPVWSFATDGYIESSAVLYGGYVYVGSYDGKVYCLDTQNGSTIWEFETGGIIRSSPTIAGNYLYVGSGDSFVYCLNALTGAPIWSFATGDMVNSSPAVSGGYVYIGSGDHKLYCLNAQTGQLQWAFTTGYWIHSSPAVSGGYVYIGSDDNKLYCLNAATGSIVWEFSAAQWIQSSPAVSSEYVYVGCDDNKLYCLNAHTGSINWEFETGGNVQSSPAIADGNLYIGSYDHKLYCLDAQTGEHKWNFTTGGYIISSPAVSDGHIYFGSADNIFYCLNAQTGVSVWEFATNYWIYASPVVANGYAYIGSADKKMYCIFSEPDDTGSWPMFKHNPARTGVN